MKTHKGTLVALFSTLFLPFASAQTLPPNTFSHIIIIVQENRAPDNIFGAYGGVNHACEPGEDPFEPGVDIENSGYNYVVTNGNGNRTLICDQFQPMNEPAGETLDPGHFFEDWTADYRGGNMDGFCHSINPNTGQVTYPGCPSPSPYAVVQESDVQPYYDIATKYGFANYMFQTNEGPSFNAHQFLFTGTSAPVAPHDLQSYYIDFVADNPLSNGFSNSGCPATDVTAYPEWVQPNGVPESDPRQLPNECYTHDSLVTDSGGDKGVSWRYYTPTVSNPNNPLGIIWDAPEAIPEVCYGTNQDNGGNCNATEFTDNVVYPGYTLNGFTYSGAPILDDIQNCQLQKISWVIPDEAWSDHPFPNMHMEPPLGPSWVGNIVDAIGNSWSQSLGGHQCDYWGTSGAGGSVVQPTAIFIVWDDWGGWYDHVSPLVALQQNAQTGSGYTPCNPEPPKNQWGCGYVYGFRVPLLVVSEYTQAGYVSGACGAAGEPVCPNKVSPYEHDFGSILAFTENNFGLGFIAEPFYADYNAPDWSADHKTTAPLVDLFKPSSPRLFSQVSTPYNASTFQQYYKTPQNGVTPVPTGPDAVPGVDED